MDDEQTANDEQTTPSAPKTYWVDCTISVKVTVNDPNAIDRCVNNEDGWRDSLYDLDTRDKVLECFAYNAVLNGETGVYLMDGWADLTSESVVMDVDRASFAVERIEEEEDNG